MQLGQLTAFLFLLVAALLAR